MLINFNFKGFYLLFLFVLCQHSGPPMVNLQSQSGDLSVSLLCVRNFFLLSLDYKLLQMNHVLFRTDFFHLSSRFFLNNTDYSLNWYPEIAQLTLIYLKSSLFKTMYKVGSTKVIIQADMSLPVFSQHQHHSSCLYISPIICIHFRVFPAFARPGNHSNYHNKL